MGVLIIVNQGIEKITGVLNIPPEMPVDQVKEEEEPAKEVIATKVNLNKLSKPSSSHVYSDFCSKIPRIFAN